jgi:hypothetical protein
VTLREKTCGETLIPQKKIVILKNLNLSLGMAIREKEKWRDLGMVFINGSSIKKSTLFKRF